MSIFKFLGRGKLPGADQVFEIDCDDPARRDDPLHYVADDALRNAVRVAIELGMPLLLTGEPGTGKTQLAYRLAAELNPDLYHRREPDQSWLWRFNTRTSSIAAELFYQYDHIGHFGASQRAALAQDSPPETRKFIRYRALGAAILCSHDWAEIEALVAPAQAAELRRFSGRANVVLIDEIDKAPRDFPNDLLDRIENQSFEVAELDDSPPIASLPARRPVVVITSNSEKHLPEAFLRRCVYHHIAFPDDKLQRRELVQNIVDKRLQSLAGQRGTGLAAVLDAFFALRDHRNVEKKPTTSELLDGLRALSRSGFDFSSALAGQGQALQACVGALAKNDGDQKLLREQLGLTAS
jgi:MoxR-like ATPase